jgi:O-antigen ligase
LIAFALPLNKSIVPLLIILLLISWILEGDFKTKMSNLKDKFFIVSCALYLLHLFGMLYTDNILNGSFDLEQKLSLVFFPILIFSENIIDEQFISKVFKNFILGCLVGCIICISNAALHYCYSHVTDSFFYVQFSCIMHPSYFALYIAFASCLLLFDNSILGKTFYKIPITIFFLVCIILLSSKSGIFSITIVFTVKFFHSLFIKKKYLKSFITLICFLLVVASLVLYFPKSTERMYSMVSSLKSNKKSLNTTTERILIWKHSLSIIAAHPIIGFGTGDANDALAETYSASNETEMKERKFNAHNQFLQTSISLGILGLLALIIPYLVIIYFSVISKNINTVMFVGLVLVNMLFEAMLETQAGVIFISFFLYLLLKQLKDSNIKSTF